MAVSAVGPLVSTFQDLMVAALASSSLTFFSTLVGGAAALRWPRHVQSLMALAGGVVLAAVFLDLLPDAVQRAVDIHMPVTVPLGCVLLGYLTFQALDHLIHEHAHVAAAAPDPAGLAGAIGFIIHSFFDGLAIGLGFRVNSSLGILVAAAVIGHDFSDGLSTVTYLRAHRQPDGRSRWLLLADATTPLCGALVASLAPVPPQVFPIALGFFSGLFVFAAATDLLPRAEELPMWRSVPLVGIGVLGMFLVTRLA